MALYKRLSQLEESNQFMPDDYLLIDRNEWSESKKITRENLLDGVVTNPDLEQAYPNSTWVRRNGTWVQIFPDQYVTDVDADEKFYVRQKGQWIELGLDDSFTGIKIYGGYVVNILPPESDLDTLNNANAMGFFQVPTAEMVKTIKGAPTEKPFAIEIMSVGSGVRQEVTESGQNGRKWYRIFDGSWGTWQEILTNNIDSFLYQIKTIKGRIY